MTGASIASFLGQVCQSRGYQLESAARVAAMNYIQIVTGFIWDIVLFKANLKVTDIVGSILIIGTLFIFAMLRAFGIIK
jgi:drug/metabolite transporter (DMT)-like permease